VVLVCSNSIQLYICLRAYLTAQSTTTTTTTTTTASSSNSDADSINIFQQFKTPLAKYKMWLFL
jgi:hypothetical protein